MPLTQDLKWLLEQCSTLQVQFIIGVKLICYFVLNYFTQWARPQNMALSNLAFYLLYDSNRQLEAGGAHTLVFRGGYHPRKRTFKTHSKHVFFK